jgi:hypothetical protein
MQITAITYYCDACGRPGTDDDKTQETPIRFGDEEQVLDLHTECAEEKRIALFRKVATADATPDADSPVLLPSDMPPNTVEAMNGTPASDALKRDYDRAECIKWCCDHGYYVGANKYIPVDARASYLRANPDVIAPDKW